MVSNLNTPTSTIVGGNIKMKDGKILGEPEDYPSL